MYTNMYVNTFVLYIHVCTMAVQCIYMSVHGSSWFILFHTMSMQNLSLLKVFPWGMLFILACTAPVPPLDNASVQESANVYIHCSYMYIQIIYPLRMAVAGGQLSCSISSKTHSYAYVSVCTWLNSVYCMSVHENVKSYRKADYLPEPFLGGIYM